MDLRQVAHWLRRLLNLDLRVFEEVRSNPDATLAGVAIMLVATLLSGLGGWFWWLLQGFGNNQDVFLHSVVVGSGVALTLWGVVWVGGVFLILTQFYRERVYLEQLLRVMGLASAPLGLSLFLFLPGISLAVGLTSLALTFALTNVSIQYVTAASPGRVLLVNGLGFLAWVSMLTLMASATVTRVEPNAPGVFLFNATTNVTRQFLEIGRGGQ